MPRGPADLGSQLLRSSIDGVFAFDLELRVTCWSDSMERISGIRAAEAIGRSALELFPALTKTRGDAPLREALNGKSVFTKNAPFRRPGRSGEVFAESYYSPLLGSRGEVAGGLAIVRDITGPRRMEEALRESEARYWRLLEDSLTANFVSTPDGQVVACNPAFTRIFGYRSVDEAMACHLRSLFRGPRSLDALLESLRARRKLEYHEAELRRADGEPVYVIANFIGSFDERGELVNIQGYIFDNTERKGLEEQLRQAQKMESIGTLAGGLAHDFNNILNIILSHATLLERLSSRKATEGLQAIRAAVDRGSGLVRQLLTFARRTEASLEPLGLNEAVNELLRMCREMFPKAIAFDVRLEPRLPPVIGDRNQLHQALLNLCINARDAMPTGGRLTIQTGVRSGVTLRKRFPAAQDGEYPFVCVADTGTGIDESTLGRVFDPFFTTKEPGRGTGLGLAVVYGIAKAHSGFIDVESEPGSGSAFTLFLPAARQGEFTAVARPEERREVAGGTETVLLVEDEELLLSAVRALLEAEGYRVVPARNGVEALALYDKYQKNVGVVLADLGLPRLGGWELFLRIKQVRPDVRVILTSGFVERQDKARMLEAGVKGVLRKPYEAREILIALREALER